MLLSEHISSNPNAPVIVLFGGSPHRRDQVVRDLQHIGDVSIIGTLNEEEGMEKIKSLPRVDLVLIGGRYDDAQRARIRKYVRENMPNTALTEPGVDYPYDTMVIREAVKAKVFK